MTTLPSTHIYNATKEHITTYNQYATYTFNCTQTIPAGLHKQYHHYRCK